MSEYPTQMYPTETALVPSPGGLPPVARVVPGAMAGRLSNTEIDRVTRMVAEAGNRMRRLEREAEAAFTEWVHAQEEASSCGLVVDLELGPGIQAALSEYKRAATREESTRIAAEEMGFREAPL